jgi:hypothetical protein
MHPQAMFIDTHTEERFLLEGIRTQASALKIPLLELPAESGNRLAWMTKLDSSSLAGEYFS